MSSDKAGQQVSPAEWDPADDSLSQDLVQAARWYAARAVPEPTREDVARLIIRLHLEETRAPRVWPPARQPIIQTMRMVRWQLYLLGPWFWITGAALLVLGVAAAPFMPHSMTTTLLIYVLPLTAVLSAVYALRRVTPGLRDMEQSSPTGFVEMMTGVVLALVCFNVVLGVLASATLALLHWTVFGSLLVSWLAPLLLLVAFSFPVALRWGTVSAVVIGGGPWLLLILAAVVRSGVISASFLLPTQPGLLLGLQLGGAGLGTFILVLLFTRGSTWQRVLLLG